VLLARCCCKPAASSHVLLLKLSPEPLVFFRQHIIVVEQVIPSLVAGLIRYLMVEVEVVKRGFIGAAPPVPPPPQPLCLGFLQAQVPKLVGKEVKLAEGDLFTSFHLAASSPCRR
jgi:hypothetical protein